MIREMGKRFNWRLSLYAATGAVVTFLPFVLTSADGVILYVPTAAVICMALSICMVRVKGPRRLSVLAMLGVYVALSVVLSENFYDARTVLRWFLWSRNYKAEVLAQPDGSDRGWKHMEWDGWGFPGAGNTVAYVVYNPSNLLAEAARNHSPGVVFTPAARLVPRVQRLENSWYAVVFYTQTDWENGGDEL